MQVPDVAVDRRRGGRDRVYVTWPDAAGGQTSQIVLVRSMDGGRSWSAASRVTTAQDVQAFNPSVEVAPDGTVGVAYADFTNDSVETEPLQTDQWLVRSTDGGRTFGPRVRLTPSSFDLRLAPQVGSSPPLRFFVGDYAGLAVDSGAFVSVFPVTTGSSTTDPTDILAARVRMR